MEVFIRIADIFIGFIGIVSLCFTLLFFIFSVLQRHPTQNHASLIVGFIGLCTTGWLLSETIRSLASEPLKTTYPEVFFGLDILISITSSFIPFLFLVFAWEFPDIRIPQRIFWALFIVHTSLISINLAFEEWFNQIFLLILIPYIIAGTYVLFQRIPKYDPPVKMHIQVLCINLSVLLTLGITSIFINNIIDTIYLQFIPELAAFGFILVVSYAVLAYRLFAFPPLLPKLLVIIALSLSTIYVQLTLILIGEASYSYLTALSLGMFIILGGALIQQVITAIEEKRLLERKQTRLQVLDQEKNKFLRVSSHQLRTPLTALEGYTSLAREESQGYSAESRRVVENLYLYIQRMQSLVQKLLSFNSLETGTFNITQQTEIDVYSLLDEIRQTETAIEDINDIHFAIDGNEGEYILSGDRPKLKSALTNLVHNAIIYTESFVKITLSRTQNGIGIGIEDNGIGITRSEHSVIFDQFERGKKAYQHNPEGSGLGLYLAKKIIELHDGTIHLESDGRGKGTTVHVWLPSDTNANASET